MYRIFWNVAIILCFLSVTTCVYTTHKNSGMLVCVIENVNTQRVNSNLESRSLRVYAYLTIFVDSYLSEQEVPDRLEISESLLALLDYVETKYAVSEERSEMIQSILEVRIALFGITEDITSMKPFWESLSRFMVNQGNLINSIKLREC